MKTRITHTHTHSNEILVLRIESDNEKHQTKPRVDDDDDEKIPTERNDNTLMMIIMTARKMVTVICATRKHRHRTYSVKTEGMCEMRSTHTHTPKYNNNKSQTKKNGECLHAPTINLNMYAKAYTKRNIIIHSHAKIKADTSIQAQEISTMTTRKKETAQQRFVSYTHAAHFTDLITFEPDPMGPSLRIRAEYTSRACHLSFNFSACWLVAFSHAHMPCGKSS